MSTNCENVVGKKFGRLVIVSTLREWGVSQKRTFVECVCDCGLRKKILLNNLKRGKTKSCGCLQKKLVSERNTTHGLKGNPIYGVWKSMRQRCKNPKDRVYKNYGGRGISVCERWNDFKLFLEDMGPKPTTKHSLDRIDVNGGYFAENCRWATHKEQGLNRTDNIFFTINNQTKTMREWADDYNIDYRLLWQRVNRDGLPIEKALTYKKFFRGQKC